jgi:hypothetical protein
MFSFVGFEFPVLLWENLSILRRLGGVSQFSQYWWSPNEEYFWLF